jgi:hypothetical protein
MRPPEEEIRQLVAEWLGKADLDFDTVVRLAPEDRFRDIVAFHAQQAAGEVSQGPPHSIPNRVSQDARDQTPADSAAPAQALDEANWLSPFGAEIRYPGDRPETAPGDVVRARQLAQTVRNAFMTALDPYLSGG